MQNLELVKKVIIAALILVTITVTPLISFDPINLPRFVMLSIFGFIVFFLLIFNSTFLTVRNFRIIIFASLMFIFWSGISNIFSDLDLNTKLVGVSGRNNGLLTYVFLVIIMLGSCLISNSLEKSLIHSIIGVGAISVFYGLIQHFNKDPFEWINPYSPVFGLFGNPNFQSTFVALSAIAAAALTTNDSVSMKYKLGLVMYVFLAMYVVSKTQSQQGLLVFLIGLLVFVFFWLKFKVKIKILTFIYTVFSLNLLLVAILDILQKVPWDPILYKPSVSYRGDYWRAGWNMTKDNAITGVGLDGFGNYYRQYRDSVSANRIESSSNVDSSHNIFIDMSSSGGFPLLSFYLLINLIVIFSIIKIMKNTEKFNVPVATLISIWVAHLAQSLISINQIAISIWGWSISGILIGLAKYNYKPHELQKVNRTNFNSIAILVGFICGLIVSFPNFRADANFRSVVVKGEVNQIITSVESYPMSTERLNFVSALFRKAGLPDQALRISKKAVNLNPRSFEAWYELSLNENLSQDQKSAAVQKLMILDPLNPSLKQ
jgi:O-antigen ligase